MFAFLLLGFGWCLLCDDFEWGDRVPGPGL